ncbi:hypothetical protein K505DRAFT_7945 [Melanomma pulvis-pyrius CBS 109.77]|uniref:Uncharacterized protein n=1 Tax=Melanomma pulvis-pyrius CBS 109.77 TaxID=1314802 RepID=A0A6A6XXF2_9PLEO|nr:hypothetical protein K505DRAFT_7945 [Melanomma pulvis-pyrius CBS 109.77]
MTNSTHFSHSPSLSNLTPTLHKSRPLSTFSLDLALSTQVFLSHCGLPLSMPRSFDTASSTINLTPSNSDVQTYRDHPAMNDTITINVPAEVAAEWIAKGVGVPAVDPNVKQLSDFEGKWLNNIKPTPDTAAKESKTTIEKDMFTTSKNGGKAKKDLFDNPYKETDMYKKVDAGDAAWDIPPKPNFIYFDPHLDGTSPKVAPIKPKLKTSTVRKTGNSFDLGRAIKAFRPQATELRSTKLAKVPPAKSSIGKLSISTLDIDHTVEAFRAHLNENRFASYSDFDSALDSLHARLLQDTSADLVEDTSKMLASAKNTIDSNPTGQNCGKAGHFTSKCTEDLMWLNVGEMCGEASHMPIDNHRYPTVFNSNESMVAMASEENSDKNIPTSITVCKGCWDGCDSCCPEFKDDVVNHQVCPGIYNCRGCDVCNTQIESHCGTPTPKQSIDEARGKQSNYRDLPWISFTETDFYNKTPAAKQGELNAPDSTLRKAFATLGLQDKESVTFNRLNDQFRERLFENPQAVVEYGRAYSIILRHQDESGKWNDVSITNNKTSATTDGEGAKDKKRERVFWDKSVLNVSTNIQDDDMPTGWGNTGLQNTDDGESVKAMKSRPWRFVVENDQSSIGSTRSSEPNKPSRWETSESGSASIQFSSDLASRPSSVHGYFPPYGPRATTGAESISGSAFRKRAISRSSLSDSIWGEIVSKDLAVTYWATVESAGKKINIPIDGKNVAGLEKTVIDAGMKKVWKWVTEKNLGDKINLQDAYDLAKEMYAMDQDHEEHARDKAVHERTFRADTSLPPSVCGGWGPLHAVS